MTDSTPSAWAHRIKACREELERLARVPLDEIRTSPDEVTGEQWTGRQVVAHFTEFLPYWLGEAARMAAASDPALPVGRTKTDPVRLEGVRHDGPAVNADDVVARASERLRAAEAAIAVLTTAEIAAPGTHFKRGLVTAGELLEVFVVEHVEEHVEQLRLAVQAASSRDGRR